jgi:hypothetical protein
LQEVAGTLPTASVTDEEYRNRSDREAEDVQRVRNVTLSAMVLSVWPAVVEVGRNRRRTAPETEKGTANWRGFRALWLDSLYPEKEGDEVVLLVRSDGEGGDWSGDVMARPTVARSGFTEKKREGEKEVAARGEEKRGEARVSREPRLEEIRGRREWLALGGEDHGSALTPCACRAGKRGRQPREKQRTASVCWVGPEGRRSGPPEKRRGGPPAGLLGVEREQGKRKRVQGRRGGFSFYFENSFSF